MTVEEAAKIHNVSKKTILDWCNKDYIRGLKIDEESGQYDIPKSMKRPYTRTRAKGDAIYKSIVTGTIKGYDVCAALYGVSKEEFEQYISELFEIGVITTYVSESTDIMYYNQTLESSRFSKLPKNKIIAFVKGLKMSVDCSLIKVG